MTGDRSRLRVRRTTNFRLPDTGRSVRVRQLAVSAISGPSALSPNFLQSGHASSSINGQPYSGAKGEPLREVAQI
jgi:hypothetical protein